VIRLALDTATPATTVALVRDNVLLGELTEVDARRHAELLVGLVDRVLRDAGVARTEIDAVAVGVGPGAYTGLRVGVATALALGRALGRPVQGVVTLDAMAAAAGVTAPFGVVTDARRKELFWARYDMGAGRVSGPHLGRPSDVAEALADLPVVGARATPFVDQFTDAREPALPAARWVAHVADRPGGAVDPVRPLYLRRPDVTVRPLVADRRR
jgi:tRNA threonylcarbamoyl adenosine modification protein YeaZ